MKPDKLTAQQIADAVRDTMFAGDRASQALGMAVEAMTPGSATVRMTVRADMLNSHRMCHGGVITTLADSAFAFACNSYNELTVASSLAVDLVAPAHEGDVLTAQANETNRARRMGVYDITVTNQRGERVAMVRGRSYTFRGKPVVELPACA